MNQLPPIPLTPTNEFVVSPFLCKQLVDAGLTRETVYRWQLDPITHTGKVQSFAWDTDGYYEKASEIIDAVTQPLYLPAYTSTDLNNVLPSYCLCKNSTGGYDLLLDQFWNAPSVNGKRLPDVLGKMVLQLLKARLLDPNKANQQISSIQNLDLCSR